MHHKYYGYVSHILLLDSSGGKLCKKVVLINVESDSSGLRLFEVIIPFKGFARKAHIGSKVSFWAKYNDLKTELFDIIDIRKG